MFSACAQPCFPQKGGMKVVASERFERDQEQESKTGTAHLRGKVGNA